MLGENSQNKPDFAGLGGTSEWLGLGPLLGSVDFRAAMHHPLVFLTYRTVLYAADQDVVYNGHCPLAR